PPASAVHVTVDPAGRGASTFGVSVRLVTRARGQFSTANLAASRPPVIVTPVKAGTRSTLSSNSSFNCDVDITQIESASIPTPDTWGVAIDVPWATAYALPGTVDRIDAPGAARCTDAAP